MTIKLDYSLDSPEERNELVKQILEENPNPGEKYLEILANYLILCMEKKERQEKKILTPNHMVTVDRREMSFEGLVSKLESGEDGLYNLIKNDKRIIFQPKVPKISQKDLEEIPFLKQIKQEISSLETKIPTLTGKDAYIWREALKELRQQQYFIRSTYRKPIQLQKKMVYSKHYLELADTTCEFDNKGYPIPQGISLLDPKVCSFIFCNYAKLKEGSYDVLMGDTWHLMQDFDALCGKAFADYPIYEKIIIYKIDGLSNLEIQDKIQTEFGIKYTPEYLSSLWRNKIPKILASTAEDEWLYNYYLNEEKGTYKKCNKCGQIKLAHPKYFSKNKMSKDGFYSICKECRKKKYKESK